MFCLLALQIYFVRQQYKMHVTMQRAMEDDDALRRYCGDAVADILHDYHEERRGKAEPESP